MVVLGPHNFTASAVPILAEKPFQLRVTRIHGLTWLDGGLGLRWSPGTHLQRIELTY
jgi:hypothetical protein